MPSVLLVVKRLFAWIPRVTCSLVNNCAASHLLAHSLCMLTLWCWQTVALKISSDKRSSRFLLPSLQDLELHAQVGGKCLNDLSFWMLNKHAHCLCLYHLLCEATPVHCGEWWFIHLLPFSGGETSIYQWGEHIARLGAGGICNDKTMIYSRWSSRGQTCNTLNMIYYLPPAKLGLCCSKRK